MHHDGLSRPLEGARLRVLSLGAGVQSTALALMAARGEIGPMPDCAIFADTQSEPSGVYEHLAWLETQLPFPVHRVTIGSLRDSVSKQARWSDGRFSAVPFFMDGGMGRRQCTKEFKVEPIERKIRELIGLAYRQHGPKLPVVEQWIGISLDEMQRMKDSRRTYIAHRWPLIEARMSRRDCLRWMEERQYPKPSKSACTFCPYHDNAAWADMKANDPASFADAVSVDALIRSRGTMRGMAKQQFVHRSLKPLADVDFSTPDKPGLFDFANECEGMCGV